MTQRTTTMTTSTTERQAKEWWRDAVIYQIYPRSFADANGDGTGDLAGITDRLLYLAQLGVDAIWLSPFYRSPQRDAGYDVSDYREVDPVFGDLDDADRLIAQAHALGLRVIVDLVPNHTSDEHAWFRDAIERGTESPARDRYIFRDGRGADGDLPPNNWRSIFGGSAWTRVSDGYGKADDKQWYLHMFDSSQPDLNWNNAEVRADFESILRFWLDRGVDGFRVDVAHGLVKQEGLPDWGGTSIMAQGEDEPEAGGAGFAGEGAPMFDQPGVHDIYRRWREVMAEYGPDKILVAEAWVDPPEKLARYVRPDEMHQAFNFDYLSVRWDADNIRRVIDRSLTAMTAVGAAPTWVLSNHDVIRHASRFGLDYDGPRPNGVRTWEPQPDAARGLSRARALTLQMLALPGGAYVYQGEELGLPEHTTMPDEFRQDPAFFRTEMAEAGRDGCRVPMPWQHDASGLGFGPSGRTWLPQPDAYKDLSVDVQAADDSSTLALYRAALRIRAERELGAGTLEWADDIAAGRDDVLAFRNGSTLVISVLGDWALSVSGYRIVLSSTGTHRADEPGDAIVCAGTTAWLESLN